MAFDSDDDSDDILFSSKFDMLEQTTTLVGDGKNKNLGDILYKSKGKMKTTFGLCAVYVCMGLCFNIVGPTLSDLKAQVNRDGDFYSISFLFVGRGMGNLAGNILGWFLCRIFNPQLIIAVSLLLASIAIGIVSAIRQLSSLIVTMFVVGLAFGVIERGDPVVCFIVGVDRSSGFPLFNFALAFGAFIASLLAIPFPHWHGTNPCNVNASKTTATLPMTWSMTNVTSEVDVPAMKAYVIISVYVSLISLLFFYFAWISPSTFEASPSHPAESSRDSDFTTIFVLMSFTFLCTAAKVSFGAFVSEVYLHSFDTVCSGTAAVVLFWGSFILGRSIPLCFTMPTSSLAFLTVNPVGTLIASLILVASTEVKPPNTQLFWIGTVLLGLSMSNLYRAGCDWLERYMYISEELHCILYIWDLSGHVVAPTVLSVFIFPSDGINDSDSYNTLLYAMVFFSFLWTALFFYVYIRAEAKGIKPTPENKSSHTSVVSDVIDGVTEALNDNAKIKKSAKQILKPKFEVRRKHTE